MKKPPKQISTAGRANPQGIPYLYLASSISTAISEVRPTVAEKISVAEFRAKKSLDIVDLRDPKIDSPFRFEHNLRHFLMHLGFLRILGSEISKPMNPNDAQFEYIPLQYLCEFIKNENYDGVAYISSISDGYNLAIFSDDKLECIETKQYLVNEVNLSYEEM